MNKKKAFDNIDKKIFHDLSMLSWNKKFLYSLKRNCEMKVIEQSKIVYFIDNYSQENIRNNKLSEHTIYMTCRLCNNVTEYVKVNVLKYNKDFIIADDEEQLHKILRKMKLKTLI